MRNTTAALWALAGAAALALVVVAPGLAPASADPPPPPTSSEKAMQVQYLEIVTPDVEATCASLQSLHGATFGPPEPLLGNGRTATLQGGGMIGVRAPMRASEEPVVRPYLLVDDVARAVATAEAGGAQIAMEPTELPGFGTFAIYLQGGIQHGLWQL